MMEKNIVDTLVSEMKQSGLGISNLSNETGLTRQTITYILSGKRNGLNLHTVCLICEALGLQIGIQKN